MTSTPPAPRPMASLATGLAQLKLAILFASLTLIAVGLISSHALIAVLTCAPIAATILLAALGLGLPLFRLLRLNTETPMAKVVLPAGLGLGLLSTLILAIGSIGIPPRPLCIALVAALVLVAFAYLLIATRAPTGPIESAPPLTPPHRLNLLYLALIPALALALYAATFPPGLLWPEEGNGYDVLEYHLAAPRHFLEAGRITFLPENIYSNFPLNVEMLYLLAMILHGDPLDAAFTAQLLHAALAILTVAAVWLAARPAGRTTATIAALFTASCPYLPYLSGLAYVEHGLLFFSALALAATTRAIQSGQSHPRSWLLLAGLFSGFACGCKYPGLFTTALPLALAIAHATLLRTPRRFAPLLIFALSTCAAFSPWLIRNTINTANPVFPLARSILPERPGLWSDEAAARWHDGHLPAPEDQPIVPRIKRLATEVLASPQFGVVIPFGLLSAFLPFARRHSLLAPISPIQSPAHDALQPLLLCARWMMLANLIVWTAFTHLAGRFAIVLIIPTAIALSLAVAQFPLIARSTLLLALAVVVPTFLNTRTTINRFLSGPYLSLALAGDPTPFTSGLMPSNAHVPRLNEITSHGGRVLLLADARRYYLNPGTDYFVVFNRNPFAEAAARLFPPQLLDWLRERGYTHLSIDWGEMNRLRRSRYGFWKEINEDLIARLVAAGMRPVEQFTLDDSGRVYNTLFEVPPPKPPVTDSTAESRTPPAATPSPPPPSLPPRSSHDEPPAPSPKLPYTVSKCTPRSPRTPAP